MARKTAAQAAVEVLQMEGVEELATGSTDAPAALFAKAATRPGP